MMKRISKTLTLNAIVLEDNGVHDGSEDTANTRPEGCSIEPVTYEALTGNDRGTEQAR